MASTLSVVSVRLTNMDNNEDSFWLSYSGMKTWRTCPEQYRLSRVVKLDEHPGWYNVGGTAVHLTTEDLDLLEAGIKQPEEVKGFSEHFYDTLKEVEESTSLPPDTWKTTGKSKALPNGEGEEWWLAHGPSMVRSWVNWRNRVPYDLWITPDGEPAIEIRFEMDLDGVMVPGMIDRVLVERSTGRLVVVDIKTGKPPKDEIQLATYADALNKRYGVDCSIGSYFMARGGVLTGLHNLKPLMGDVLRYEYHQVATAVKNKVFLPTPGGLCRNYCSFNWACYAGGYMQNESYVPWKKESSD